MRFRLLHLFAMCLVGALIAAACGTGGDDPPDASLTEVPQDTEQAADEAPAQSAVDPAADAAAEESEAEPAVAEETPAEEAAEPEAVTSYTVEAGDTLSELAATFGTTVDDLVALNGLANANDLRVGQVLLLPGAPEDEETVAELEAEDDPSSEEPEAAEEEEPAPASPPAAPPVTGTSPEGIPQPGPEVRVEDVPQRPADFENYATTALTWLHTRTMVDDVLEIFLEWGMPTVFGGDRLNRVDTDLDGLSSMVIVWTNPLGTSPWVESNLTIYDPLPSDPESYRLAYDHSLARGETPGNIAVLEVVDVTGDGRRDITFMEQSCGAHTCTSSFHVLVRDGSGYRNAALAPVDIPTAFAIDAREDVTGDGLADLQVSGGTFGSVGAEPQREFAWVFSAASGMLQQVSRVGLPTRWLVWALLEANEAFDRQDWARAVTLYNVVLSDDNLEEFAPFAGEGEELRSIANLRKSLALGASGDEVGAQAAAQALSAGAGLVAELGGAYLSGLASGNVAAGCRAFNDALGPRVSEWDAFWSNYGYGVPQVTATELCPF